eukprot:scaffold1525_cov142-Cylindrotheca_fusiformis.AAC.44
MAAVFNFTFLRAQNKLGYEARPVLRAKSSPMSVDALPDFPTKSAPIKGGIAEWNFWAMDSPMGSFKYQNTALLHFPYVDLDQFYGARQEQRPKQTRGSFVGDGYPPAVALKGANIAIPDKHTCFSLTRKGYKPNPIGIETSVNQDRVVIMTYPDREDEWWMGLFDGHGDLGHATSHYASVEFPNRIQALSSKQSQMSQEEIKDGLKKIFEDIDRELPTNVNVGGSTAISIWKTGDLIYISNLGDSQAFVASFDNNGNNVELIQTTEPHKPDLPGERARIEAAGGQVELSPFPGASARVVIPINQFEAMALAMSRSLGDAEGNKVGVISEPTTEVLDLRSLSKDLNYVVVAATDGIFDQIAMAEVAMHIAKSIAKPTPLGLAEATEQLILKSSYRWFDESTIHNMMLYRDDISIAVHRLII